MKVSVIASAPVGLLAAANFAELGHDVVCAGFGPNAGEFVESHRLANVRFTPSRIAATRHGQLVFIAFGSPGAGVGRARALPELITAAVEVAENLQGPAVVISDATIATTNYVAQCMVKHTNQQIVVVPGHNFRRQSPRDCAWPTFLAPARLGPTPRGKQKE